MQAEQGFAILLVEHDVELVASFTERAYVLDFGTLIAEGPTDEVLDSAAVREAYLGDVQDRRVTRGPRARGVAAGYGPFRALFDVSLAVAPGEAVALLGPNGAGKTTVARVATGLVRPTAGAVRVEGDDLTGAPAHRFARAGVAHAPEGRSVFATLTVEENLRLSFRRALGRAGVGAALDRAYELFPALGRRRGQLAGTLSGGEQRMLSLARVLVESPQLLIADELSLGLAPIIVDEVYADAGPPPGRGHVAADRRAAHGPRARPVRPGGPARPGHGDVGGPVGPGRRPRGRGAVRPLVTRQPARTAATAASAARLAASVAPRASRTRPGIRAGWRTR